jgi:hypothetical protein
MKKNMLKTAALAAFACSVLFGPALAAGSITLAWDPSTNSSVAGYNIYYGGAKGTYTNKISAGNATNVTVSGLASGTTYYFVATTYNTMGLESSFSRVVSGLVPSNLPPPTGLHIVIN